MPPTNKQSTDTIKSKTFRRGSLSADLFLPSAVSIGPARLTQERCRAERPLIERITGGFRIAEFHDGCACETLDQVVFNFSHHSGDFIAQHILH